MKLEKRTREEKKALFKSIMELIDSIIMLIWIIAGLIIIIF